MGAPAHDERWAAACPARLVRPLQLASRLRCLRRSAKRRIASIRLSSVASSRVSPPARARPSRNAVSRSLLANLGILAGEGLAVDRQAHAIEHAEILAVAPFARAALRPDALGHALALRELLATLTGPTAAVLLTWLDDALRGD